MSRSVRGSTIPVGAGMPSSSRRRAMAELMVAASALRRPGSKGWRAVDASVLVVFMGPG